MSNFDEKQHILNCVLIGKLIRNKPELTWYALKYFETHPSPFDGHKLSSPKRCKTMEDFQVTDLDLVESTYILLKSNPNFYRKRWNWSNFVNKYLDHEDTKIKWIVCHCIAILTAMNETQLKLLINSKISPEIANQLSCSYTFSDTPNENETDLEITKIINEENTINIAGINIPKISSSPQSQTKLIEVESTKNNLRKIALGLTSNKAICLQGPVGCGKTTLVEYLANKTGRQLGVDFIKIQLGDQTDSKMLLGTYRCTDIPGEFIWQPGLVTQAVMEGSWLLLEDIDSVGMDIASVLTGLLESSSLTVPGYRDSLPIAPGFQLFVTQRFLSTVSGFHKKHSNAMTLLEKHLYQVNIDPLSGDELKEIVVTNYNEFRTISDRMLNVFQLFTKNNSDSIQTKIGRLISTRDFFKWCSRAIIDFDVKSQASALKVLQDAIDVFCCSFSNKEESLNLAKAISSQLGIISQKVEYFYNNYKPTMALTNDKLIVGRASMKRDTILKKKSTNFYFTRPTSVLLERIMCCINLKEPVLLVGETGTGKTSAIQYLANITGHNLIVINMNQQSDSADLLGGFKPVDLGFVIKPIKREFEHVFCDYFKIEPNRKFLSHIDYCFNKERWSDLVKLMMKSYEAAIARLTTNSQNQNEKSRKRSLSVDQIKQTEKNQQFLKRWESVGGKLTKLSLQLKQKNSLAFTFIEGSLVKAIENGYWVLLDEINLANAETLECLSGLLEGSESSLCLLERGDKEPVKRHENFTLFACMNPSTDVGKKDLPAGLRSRFTEFFVDELTEENDLLLLVSNYLEAMSLKKDYLNKMVDFYLKIRTETITSLSDGLGHKPHYSLRTLCRALLIASKNPCGMFKKSLYEAFCLSFLTQLDASSYLIVQRMIAKYLIGDEKELKGILKQPIPQPKDFKEDNYVNFEGYWIRKGNLECTVLEDYILTESVRKNLKDLVRVVSIGKLPVLLQGDTSVGKTSLIAYLAKSSGNKCLRINNHEHTDLQEYIGSYVADINGKLVFKEGLLVEAMRKGHWIILDELNLAPTDVLEALNRVLDDNRELFIPETQEVVVANPNFMLFATQNPPGSYGGRKLLSRAFRNRFVELHFNEIPPKELEFILHQRCQMPSSYAKKMIHVMIDLQMTRRGSAAFAGKKSFITLRDLFRWGERYRLAQNTKTLYDWDQHLADEGYLILAGRVRKSNENNEIIQVLEKHLKRKVIPENLFTLSESTSAVTKDILMKIDLNRAKHENIVWTFNMRQLFVLVGKALQFKEPVLLVGETGGGKTTVCKLLAENNGQELVTVNCHMHSESSDFIGGLRPVRDHTDDNANKLFEWIDGPLIQAMLKGSIFLADEISLADDSVLERLNSLLEPERTLLLAEKGIDINNSENSEQIKANNNFYFIGTMNPGGDFGKKELSPALRNRFTEIWCESCINRNDLIDIIEQNIHPNLCIGNQEDGSSGIGICIMDFIEWFRTTDIGKRFTVSIRDILTWVNFLNVVSKNTTIFDAYLHGACLTFLDSLGSGVTGTESLKSLNKFKNECLQFLTNQIKLFCHTYHNIITDNLVVETNGNLFGIKPFYIEIGFDNEIDNIFSFNAPTTIYNTLRLLRGMQLNKAILLEGSPGVGKTSLVTALAKYTKHKIFRINLSDQTDISDLFGADLPVEGGSGGQFSWKDGPLLQALKQGHWILLDELNLASQSVLEGLNACLDHRGEIFIPELGKTFTVKSGTRFFACQNPLKQGGSRRGLPKSFLNRFIQVYVNSLTDKDLEFILNKQFQSLPSNVIKKMVEFNSRVVNELESYNFGNKGAPWQFNLRDLTRWCEAVLYNFEMNSNDMEEYQPERLVNLIYADRMRTLNDKNKMQEVFEEIFKCKIKGDDPILYINSNQVFIGDIWLNKINSNVNLNVLANDKSCLVLRSQLTNLRSLAYCVNLNWMCLLVGNSASGKSSIVKTLANLAGKTLRTLPVTSAMDTTDILGGFEQTDYTRHLDEVVKETEQLLQETLQNLLINQQTHRASELLQIWESYLNLEDEKPNRTMIEETKLFLRKITKLEDIWDNIMAIDHLQKQKIIEKLRNKSKIMANCVKNDESLNAGGKFEWIDSLLIKCLQEGSWLLIDNVNLCSAAVLDRLNALLEPQGVLIISERGVDKNGQMIEIKPHPDFRLFLTMDPKNGEISRAMRNRGIEIYLLNEKENIEWNNFDLMSLINLEGLTNKHHINSLLKLHNFINDLILTDKANINELLHAASLISQQLNHSTYLFEAFFNTIIEIYYKTRSVIEFNCNDPLIVIKNELENILTNEFLVADDDQLILYNENISLKIKNLEICSDLEKIKQQAVAIEGLLLNSNNDLLNYLLINFYTITSSEDLNLRHIYLNNLLNRLDAKKFIKNINCFYEIIKKHEIPQQLLPLDLRWLPDIISSQENIYNSNKIILALFIANQYLKQNSEIEEKEDNFKKLSQISLLDYMKSRREKNIEDCFNDVIINEFLNLLDEFDKNLQNIINLNIKIDDRTVIHILYLLSWRFIFYRCTMVNIKKITSNERYFIHTNLKVHYKWFLKYAINKVSEILQKEPSLSMNDSLKIINTNLDNQFSLLQKIGKNYQKFNEKPPPFINEQQLIQIPLFNEISKIYNVCNKQTNIAKTLNIFNNDKQFRDDLIELKSQLSDFDFAKESCEELKNLKLKNQTYTDDDCEITTTVTNYEMELMPIFDHFIQLVIRKIIISSNSNEITEENVSRLKNNVTVPTDFIGTLLLYSKTKNNKLYHEITRHYMLYLLNSASICPNRYLNLNQINEDELILFNYHPHLSYYLTNLLIPESNSAVTTTLGNYRDLMKQLKQLRVLLWRNMQQLSDESNDYLYLEIQYVNNNYKLFIKQFAESLGIKDFLDCSDIKLLTDKCIKYLELISKSNQQVTFIIETLLNCVENVENLNTSKSLNRKLLFISNIYMELSYLKAILNSKLPLIDPLAKISLKKTYCVEAISNFKIMNQSYEVLNSVYSNSNKTLHSYYWPINEMIHEMENKNFKLGKYVAVRSKDVLYRTVLNIINYGFSTLLSMKDVEKTILTLNEHINELITSTEKGTVIICKNSRKCLNQYKYRITSIESLIFEWTKYCNSYPDIMQPLLSNITEYLYGLKLKLNLLSKLIEECENLKFGVNFQQEMLNFIKFPFLNRNQFNYITHINSYLNSHLKTFVNNSLKNELNSNIVKEENYRLLKCGIQETYNNCIIEAINCENLTKNVFQHFNKLIKIFVDAWNGQEEEKIIEQNEAESLYKTKTKCEYKTEEEQMQHELKELFPNYHDIDFQDFQMNSELANDNSLVDNKDDDLSHTTICDDDLKLVVQLHMLIVNNFTKSEWLNPTKTKEQISPNFIKPFVEKYKLFKQLLNKHFVCTDYRLDEEIVGSLSVLLNVAQNCENFNSFSVQNTSHNFYKDPNIEEVKSSHYLLEDLRVRITQLLEEWPEQATLTTILTVIDRIYNFDITSPLSRFLTGFEILLQKLNEWEEVAHAGVSLCEYSQNITLKIISWRKLELNVWKDLLNSAFDRMNQPIYKWWIYIYNIMQQYITEEKFTEIELIETLQLFITKSNLAEFQNRLELFYTFHCHAIYLNYNKRTESFISILWNLYNYFQQFLINVVNKIKDLRSPIEKKLKDFVKIVRWKDINYWAIRGTVEKSHKTLHKYLKEFESALQAPANSCLVNVGSNSQIENVGIWDRPQRHIPKTYHYTLDVHKYMAKQTLLKKITKGDDKSEGILNKSESYFLKSRKLCEKTISNTKYPNLMQYLDGFITEIIETSTHLQNLEVDRTLSKQKQISQAKHILNQKHRALADLFKNLNKIGLSFRTGIIAGKLKVASTDFLLKPIDIVANFTHTHSKKINCKDEKIITIWDNCETYFVKCLMRSDVLETALKNPASDLGLQNIERCKGFSSHLSLLINQQKTELTESTRTFYYLRYYMNQITEICEGKQFLKIETVNVAKEMFQNILIVMEEFKIILNSCPEENNELFEVPILKSNDNNCIEHQHDQLWNKSSDLISDIIPIVNKLLINLEKSKGNIPSVEYELIYSKFIPINDLKMMQVDLDILSEKIEKLQIIFGTIPLTENLTYLRMEIEKLKYLLNENIETDETEFIGYLMDVKILVKKLSEKILIVIQNIFKKYSEIVTEPSESENENLLDEHLNVLIIENLTNDINVLDMKKILKSTEKIAKILFHLPPNIIENVKTVIYHCLPLLEQISLLYQYFITQQVSAYRLSCKMNSILLNIFIELVSKGFCTPPDLSDDDNSEGISNQSSGGFGLGDGEGEKDVSEQIESEDQLEEAQPAGQEKEKTDDPDCKEEDKGIEMSEDFDSKLQDIEQDKENEENENDDQGDSDAEEQMGETEKGADKLDEEIWGSDEEEDGDNQNDDSEEKGNKGEKESEKELGAKENDSKSNEADSNEDSSKEKEQQQKEINEMNEPEYDEDQIDPYHGNQPELPEPEPMDLPDDMQLDEGEENDKENDEENPFDIDTMKEQNIPDDKIEEEQTEKDKDQANDEVDEYSSEDEEIQKHQAEETHDDNDKEENEDEINKESVENKTEENKEDENLDGGEETEGLDQTQTNEDNVEAMEVDKAEAADKTQASQIDNPKSNQQIDNLCQEDQPDKEGVGQSQMEESSSGHSAQTTDCSKDLQNSKRQHEDEIEKKQKPGDSDSQRSLGDVNEPVKKKLKTIDTKQDDKEGNDEETKNYEETEELYKHIKDAKETSTQVLDVATKEQAELQQKDIDSLNEEETEEPKESSNDLLEDNKEEDIEINDGEVQNSEKLSDSDKKDKSNKRQHPEGEILDDIQDINVEGEIIETHTVPRGTDSAYYTQLNDINQTSIAKLSVIEIKNLRTEVERQLAAWKESPSNLEAEEAWQKISSVTSSLAQDLSEQLRLVLEPTQATQLKGDFRTGKRINMRKVIPYIASQFRKDKIWLRRTKPSKREYQIVLAIDDSSSMADNKSKELTFESVALISKALTLLESGQLAVLSFGETTEVLHKLTDQFTDRSGVKLLQKFKFDQNKTCVGNLVDFVTEMFEQTQVHNSFVLNAKLLVIVSDGRGIFSEGETYVKQAVRRARLANIFMVFVIVDNPENKNSILDIRMPVFKNNKLEGIQNYMDVFPFSFYIILRDINSLPNVLSDALRQWFEVVSNLAEQ